VWCDFVVWCPHQIFVQRIEYDTVFISKCLLKAKKFYFEKFLPSLAPYVIIKDSDQAINAMDSRNSKTASVDTKHTTMVSEGSATAKSVIKKTACTNLSPCLVVSCDKPSSNQSVKKHDIQIAKLAQSHYKLLCRVVPPPSQLSKKLLVPTCHLVW